MNEIRVMPDSKTVANILAAKPKRRGYCPVCDRPTNLHVHQQCGRALEDAHRARRKGTCK
jgi:hypothetical protein